jgi:hypothetical protein
LAERHEDWALGYVDEVWWSRLAQPKMHAWCFANDRALRLMQKSKDKDEKEPVALACYGVWLTKQQQMLLRFVKGRPVSPVTTEFLGWVCARLEAQGTRVWALIWDNASWHKSQTVRRWIRQHNARCKVEGGVRIVVCLLPVQSPWLSPIEPRWLHGKRAIVEPERKLTAEEVIDRVHAYYGCERLAPIAQETP